MRCLSFFLSVYGDHRKLHVLTHAFPSPRASDPQRLPPQSPIAILIAVIDAPPIARRPLDERRMAARPPFFGRRGGANERVAGAILPRPMDRPRARGDHHTIGRASGRERVCQYV